MPFPCYTLQEGFWFAARPIFVAMTLVEELQWRGLIHDIMPGTELWLESGPGTAYIGFDPTADSLHVGHFVPVMVLSHLQRRGHKVLAIIGGATGMIGDPSGKSEERNLLDEATLRHNEKAIGAQLARFLDFSAATTQPRCSTTTTGFATWATWSLSATWASTSPSIT
jgi:tyrosyl-tRNA synthetase